MTAKTEEQQHKVGTLSVNKSALREIAEQFGLSFIVLFGSVAKGRMNKESDVDIAVWVELLTDDEESLADWTIALGSSLAETIPNGEGIDLVVLNRVASLLQFQVARHGVLLYERVPNSWRCFKSYAARRYDDDARFRRWQWEYLRRCYLQ
ncbi:nucleotidyltransferase domain-containing protein [Candidatus Poribacteria bacterium]|nr:nucleotidyltransferase domain-containing protein [Candidatus Poribacteria bacterium]